MVFGVILGTGCGGGVVIDGKVLRGRNHVTGEWGHNPLPWPQPDELPGRQCWCGHWGCLETWIAGPALARDCDGEGAHDASGIPARAAAGEARAQAALDRHADRLARGLAHVINLLDPDVIVLGGGLSNMDHLYAALPPLVHALRVQRLRADADRAQQARRFVRRARRRLAVAQPGDAVPAFCRDCLATIAIVMRDSGTGQRPNWPVPLAACDRAPASSAIPNCSR